MKSTIAATVLLALAATVACAAGPANVVGYNRIVVPANSDVLVSAPFTGEPNGPHTVTSVAGNTLTVAAGSFAGGEYDAGTEFGRYYVRFTSGAAEGRWSTIASNASNTVTLETAVAGVAADDAFVIYPHNTLGSVFSSKTLGLSYVASDSLFKRNTDVLIPHTASTGINKASSATYYYKDGAWRRFGKPLTATYDDAVLEPGQYFILRNRTDAALTYLVTGVAPTVALTRTLPVQSQQNDVASTTGRPVPLTLSGLQLGGSDAFETTVTLGNRQDELLVFDNAATGFNKSPSATYYYYNGAWRKDGESATVSYDNETIGVGAGLIIRKAAGTVGTVEWNQKAPY
jgi:uncharacterized protein (TIGR02597 family)